MPRLSLYVSRSSWVATDGRGGVVARSERAFEIADGAWKEVSTAIHEAAGRVRLQVMVSASLCRHRVSPWISANSTPAAMRAQIEFEHAEEGVVSGKTHRIEIAWPSYGASAVSVAYPLDLVDALMAALNSDGHRLSSVESSAAAVLRALSGNFPESAMLLAYAEGDGISAIHVENDHVAGFETLLPAGDGYDGILAWCRRQQCRFERDSQLYWLATTPRPDFFPGDELSPGKLGIDAGLNPLMRDLA